MYALAAALMFVLLLFVWPKNPDRPCCQATKQKYNDL
jgi:hypothetical protein